MPMSGVRHSSWRISWLPFVPCGRVGSEIRCALHRSSRFASCVAGLPQAQQPATVLDFSAKWYAKMLDERAEAEAHRNLDGPADFAGGVTWNPPLAVVKLVARRWRRQVHSRFLAVGCPDG